MMGLSHQSQARLEAWWNNEGFDARPCIMAWLPNKKVLPELRYGDDEISKAKATREYKI